MSEWSEAKIALRTALAGEQAPQAVELPALPEPAGWANHASLISARLGRERYGNAGASEQHTWREGGPAGYHSEPLFTADAMQAYAREAVSAALAAQADKPAVQAVPLTPDQLADKCEAWLQGPDNFMCTNPVDAFEEGFRAAEVHHGVTGAKP